MRCTLAGLCCSTTMVVQLSLKTTSPHILTALHHARAAAWQDRRRLHRAAAQDYII